MLLNIDIILRISIKKITCLMSINKVRNTISKSLHANLLENYHFLLSFLVKSV